MRAAVLFGALFAALAAAPVVRAQPSPCSDPGYAQFDFWAGDWDVFRPDGQKVGANRVEKEYGGCVLHERYVTARTYRGESLNTYDPHRKVWHQTWVDNGGMLLLLEGGLRDGSMVLEGQTLDATGPTRHRITWTPNADGSVRQHWQSAPPGADWKTAFDGRYVRRVK